MTHLTDDQLNEALDNSLFDNSILGHLDACVECRMKLEDLRSIFAVIDSLPEVKPPRDLTASILARLPQRISPRTWTWLSLAQALGAFAILAWLASSFILPPEIAAYQPPTFDSMLASVLLALSSFPFEIDPSSFIFPPSSFDLQSTTILMFIISAAILWLVGNGLLLRAPLRDSRK